MSGNEMPPPHDPQPKPGGESGNPAPEASAVDIYYTTLVEILKSDLVVLTKWIKNRITK